GALSGDVRNVATALIVRLWAAMGPADELGVYLFDYIKRTDEKWHDFWANKVLPQLRSSLDEYRKQFSKTALDAIEENCGLLERNASVSPTLIGMAAATRKTIERIRYEAERPKIEKPGEKAAPSVRS